MTCLGTQEKLPGEEVWRNEPSSSNLCPVPLATWSAHPSTQRFAYQNWLFKLFWFVHLLGFTLLCSEKAFASSSFQAAHLKTLLWINKLNWFFMPSFLTSHMACSTFEWDCLQRLKLDFWDLAGSTLSWAHKSLAEMKVISKHIVPRMILNFLYSTALWLQHAAHWDCFPTSILSLGLGEQASQLHCFPFWEKWAYIRKHHEFRCSLSYRYGSVFLADMFHVLALLPKRFSASLPGRWIGK